MNDKHPITPPPELVHQWADMLSSRSDQVVFSLAAQWGADQELEACCEWFVRDWTDIETADKLRAQRRPKPPSLKEQALKVVTGLEKRWDLQCDLACLRRALEALPND
jgi:hypothetical protein